VDERVVKLATFLPVTDEVLEDTPSLITYIDSRLTAYIRQEEERQLLHGQGEPEDAETPELHGFIDRIPGGQADLADGDNDLDRVYAAMSAVRAAFAEPSGIVMNPADMQALRLMKDQTDNYLGGNPFQGAGGGASLFGISVVVTASMTAGSVLVGDFRGAACVFRRGGLTVELAERAETRKRGEDRAGAAAVAELVLASDAQLVGVGVVGMLAHAVHESRVARRLPHVLRDRDRHPTVRSLRWNQRRGWTATPIR
jgi:HK97 family phage major capsid protein